MPELKTIRRVTVYADGTLEQPILNLCKKFGARGYTVLAVRDGKGDHTAVQGKFSTTPQRVRIEVLADPEVAETIMTALANDAFAQRPVLACVETVEVHARTAY